MLCAGALLLLQQEFLSWSFQRCSASRCWERHVVVHRFERSLVKLSVLLDFDFNATPPTTQDFPWLTLLSSYLSTLKLGSMLSE